MNIDDIRSNEKLQFSSEKEYYELALEAFKEGSYREVIRVLTFAFNEDWSYKPSYELAYQSMQELGYIEEAELFASAISSFEDYKTFYDLGYYYIDVGHCRLAVPFLKRALELSGGSREIAIELSVAYTSQFEPKKGLELLKNTDLGRDFWAWYQYYWCALLSGEVEGISKFINRARECFNEELKEEDADLASLYYVLDKLEQCLVRYNTIDYIQPIIRHWHYIQYGAAILDYCNEGDSKGVLEESEGRYGARIGSYSDVKKVIYKLKAYIERLGFYPETVYFLMDRDSEILGRVLAKGLNVTCKEYCNQKVKEKHIIIAADNRDFNVCPELAVVKKKEMVFAFNHHWMENSLITPDVSGFMTQSYVFPWQDNIKNIDAKDIEVSEERKLFIDEIVNAIEKEDVKVDCDFEGILQFYFERKDYLKTGKKGGYGRLAFNTDTPVKSSYFS